MNIFVWNCQGAGNTKFYRFLKEYLWDFDLDVVVLVETWIIGFTVEKVIQSIGWPKSHRVEASWFLEGNFDIMEIFNFS